MMSSSTLHRRVCPHASQATTPVTCCTRRSPTASQEDEEVEEGNSLSKHGRELQRLLKTTGLSESDDDPSNEVKPVLHRISCLPFVCSMHEHLYGSSNDKSDPLIVMHFLSHQGCMPV